MKVTVKLGAPLSQVVGQRQVSLHLADGSTAADALAELHALLPGLEAGLKGQGPRYPLDQILYQLFVNAHPVPFDQAGDVLLADGDRMFIFLPVAGG